MATPDARKAVQTWKKLLQNRSIFIGTPIDDYIAKTVIAQLLFLTKEDPRRPIQLLVDSPGGYVASTLSIYDALVATAVEVRTHALRSVSGTAVLLVAAGTRQARSCLPLTSFGLVPISGGEVHPAEEVDRLRTVFAGLLAKATGREAAQIDADLRSGRALSGKEAKAYGLIDRVVDDVPGFPA